MAFEVKHPTRSVVIVTLECGICRRNLDELHAWRDDEGGEPYLLSFWYDVENDRPPKPPVSRQERPASDWMSSQLVYSCHSKKCGASHPPVKRLTLTNLVLRAQAEGTKKVSTYDLGLVPAGRRRHKLRANA